ncbi:MAG TPA: hypothetical protein VLM11_00895 [Streptosporangiaceae bacterium]|nr:hypothetical protein [Streptosporangiaceae bacterium]
MKVICIRVGVLAASGGLPASAFGLTVITASQATAGTVSIAIGSPATACAAATVIEAGRCMPV